MGALIEAVRWLNYVSPWNRGKHLLAKRVAPRLRVPPQPRVYGGIQGDLRMRLDLACSPERKIYLNTYDVVTVSLLRKLLRPGDVYVDAGANLGLFVLIASRIVGPTGKVYAFEPMPRTLSRLCEHIALSAAGDNIEVIPKGCWSQAGSATLYGFSDGHHGETSMAKLSTKSVGTQVTIETVRIDEVVRPPVKVLKVDVEGAEWGALRGAQKLLESERPPHLLIELNPKTAAAFGYHPLELVDWLGSIGRGRKLHLLTSRRCKPIDRDGLQRLFDQDPTKIREVWFEPPEPSEPPG